METGKSVRCGAPDWLAAIVRTARDASRRSRSDRRVARRAGLFGVQFSLPFRGTMGEAQRVRLISSAIDLRLIRSRLRPRTHLDAIHRAGCDTQLATRATLGEHGMHEFRRANDGIHGAGRLAARTADAS